MADRSVSVLMTLSDFEKRNTMGQIFLADLHNYVRMVWPTMTKFGMGKRVSMGSATPHHKGGGFPAFPKFRYLLNVRTKHEKRQLNFAWW